MGAREDLNDRFQKDCENENGDTQSYRDRPHPGHQDDSTEKNAQQHMPKRQKCRLEGARSGSGPT